MLKNPSIVIIGAGAAGISAARRLLENGFVDVVILEAQSRIGGRINSVDFDGRVVDLGAQWCHGEENNIVYNMVKHLDLLEGSFNTYQKNVFYDSGGKRIDTDVTDKLFGIFGKITYDIETLETTEGSFGDYFIKCYKECVSEEFGNNQECQNIAAKMLDWFHKFTLCYDAPPTWFDLSASGLTHFEECEGNPLLHWKQHGFNIILDILMNKYPDASKTLPVNEKVLLKKEVCKIMWQNAQDRVLVSCIDGSEFVADHVILTTSLGVLKDRHKTLFLPELPLHKQNAIEGLGIGTVNKIFLKFPSRWWPIDCPGFSLVWNKDDRLNVLNKFPSGPSQDGRSWLEDVFGFYVIDSDPTTLMGWVVGRHAPEVELLSDDIVLDGCMYLLRKFVGDHYHIPKPEKVLCSKWYSNPYFRGSYSYRSIESSKRNVFAKNLAEPINAKKDALSVLFAGEATHCKFYSSVHGAIESGFREADRIIAKYQSKWTSSSWIKGGYSYTTPRNEESGFRPTTLSNPVIIEGVPKVLLAGEAAHLSHFSTTHGAFESGEQQARVLLEYLMS